MDGIYMFLYLYCALYCGFDAVAMTGTKYDIAQIKKITTFAFQTDFVTEGCVHRLNYIPLLF